MLWQYTPCFAPKVGKRISQLDLLDSLLGIIVAALSFISVSQFTDMSVENPSGWQIATWIVVLLAILALTGTLVYAGLRILKRK